MTRRFLLGNLVAVLLPMLPGSAAEPDFTALNTAFGIPLWADDNLWADADAEVAVRLHLPAESRTSGDSSYRIYPGSKSKVLGARPYSLAFYGKDGRADRISMVFANKGDNVESDPVTHRSGDYKKQIGADAKTIHDALTQVLGEPKIDRFGQGIKTREQVERWDWKGHAILLAAPRGEYVAVRVVPTAVADGEAVAHAGGADMRDKLKARVEHRPNGDVILNDMPMVDQGPKGYCVPATWERALRYVGVPADMYVLAMAGQTDEGGGTNLNAMMAGAAEIVAKSGRYLDTRGGRVTAQSVARYIDQGLPILWGMNVLGDLNRSVTERSKARRAVTDWTAYKQGLRPWRQQALRLRGNMGDGHMCMIIGYNAATHEIAISDSWGPQYAERWMTEEEANAISQGQLTVINR